VIAFVLLGAMILPLVTRRPGEARRDRLLGGPLRRPGVNG
jgi:hypothetical protein